MKPFDLKAEKSDEAIGRSLRRRLLARKKLSDRVEEELEQMIRRLAGRGAVSNGSHAMMIGELYFLYIDITAPVSRWRADSVWCCGVRASLLTA